MNLPPTRTLRALAALVAGVLLLASAAVLAPAASADPAPSEVSINGGSPLVRDESCGTLTPPADNNYCWDGAGLLILNDVDINSIRASNVNLTIYLIGVSVVRGVSNDAVSVFNGNLLFDGSGTPRIELGTDGQTMIAINMAPVDTPGSLTVGTSTSTVTVRVIAGQAPGSPPATVEAGNTYELPGGPGGPGGPGPAAPTTLSVGGVLLIDEGVRTDNNVPGVTIDRVIIPPVVEFWTVVFDGSVAPAAPTQYGPVEVGGGESPFFTADGQVAIDSNGSNNLSIDARDGNAGVVFIGSETAESFFFLEGGIATNDSVILDGTVTVRVGSSTIPSLAGIEVGRDLAAYNNGGTSGSATLEIYTAETVTGISAAPASNPQISAQSDGIIRVVSGGMAVSGFTPEQVRVSNGGQLDLRFASTLGVANGVSLVWPLAPVGCIDFDAPMLEPDLVPADTAGDFGTDPDKRHILVTGEGVYQLTSTAPGLVNLSWEQGVDSQNPVTGGQVCVIASRGMAQVDQGVFFSFSIEEGSEVTILLLPEYEHQFVSGEFETLGPEGGILPVSAPDSVIVDPIVENTAQYTFTMPGQNIQLSTVFDPVADPTADVAGTNVVDAAAVEVNPLDINGNAQLEIDDLPEPANAGDFEAEAGGRTIGAYLDVTLEQQIQQGSTPGVWTDDITSLGEPATVELELSDELQGFTDYTVIHDDGETVTAVDATYDPATGTLVFETDGFSTFAIAHGPRAMLSNTGVDLSVVAGIMGFAGMLLLGGSALLVARDRRRLS